MWKIGVPALSESSIFYHQSNNVLIKPCLIINDIYFMYSSKISLIEITKF